MEKHLTFILTISQCLRVDIGEIVATAKIDIADDDVYPVLHDKLADLGADLLINTLNRLPEVLNSAKPQGEDGATYGIIIFYCHSHFYPLRLFLK